MSAQRPVDLPTKAQLSRRFRASLVSHLVDASGGDYGTDEQWAGHVGNPWGDDDGFCPNPECRLLDDTWTETTLTEVCVPLEEVDMHTFGELQASPVETFPSGGYATGPFDCLLGQWVLFEGEGYWMNASPHVDEDYRKFDCILLEHPSNQAGC